MRTSAAGRPLLQFAVLWSKAAHGDAFELGGDPGGVVDLPQTLFLSESIESAVSPEHGS